MSSTLDYRVAVLLCGQSRTYRICLPAIAKFFSNEQTDNLKRRVKVDYFLHTWDTNQWTTKGSDKRKLGSIGYVPADIDMDLISSTLRTLKNYEIEVFDRFKIHPFWGPSLHSFFRANRLKRIYENEQGFTYDLVIKVRLDQVWFPTAFFQFRDIVQNRFIYTSSGAFRIKYELNSFNLDDVWFFGDSATMNSASYLYKYVNQVLGGRNYRSNTKRNFYYPEAFLGPGTLMNRYLNRINIQGINWVDYFSYVVVRKDALDNGWTYENNFPEIRENSLEYYNK